MADDVGLVELRARVREDADIVNDTARYPDATIDRAIQAAGHFVYDNILSRFDRYGSTTGSLTNISTSGTVELWTAPTNFYRLYLIRGLVGNDWKELFPIPEELRVSLRNVIDPNGRPFYDFVGNSIQLLPAPTFNRQFVIEYAPTFPHLAVAVVGPPAVAAVDFPGVNGWEDAVVAYAVWKLKRRDDRVSPDDDTEVTRTLARISLQAGKRNEHRPRRLRDVYDVSGADTEYAPGPLELHRMT